jgi:hypothetical protein
MKQLIRKNCFETNSSSAHSVTLAGDENFILNTIYPEEDGIVRIELQTFGWEWFKTNDPETKAAYAYQQYENDKATSKLIENVIKEQTGADKVLFIGDKNNYYIDHESQGCLNATTKEQIRDFIFNKNSWLFGGNDNTTAEPSFYEVPIYKSKDNKIVVTKIRPTHCLEFDALKGGVNSMQFSHVPNEEEVGKALQWALGSDYDAFLLNDYFFHKENMIDGFGRSSRQIEGAYEYEGYEYDEKTKTGTATFCLKSVRGKERNSPENKKSYNFAVVKIAK